MRIPAWVTPDHLTLIGLAGMFLAGLFYYFSQWNPLLLHIVNLWIPVNWFGDSLDETLARYRRKLCPRYGFYVDHMIDNFGVLFMTNGLALSGFMHQGIASAVLVFYLPASKASNRRKLYCLETGVGSTLSGPRP